MTAMRSLGDARRRRPGRAPAPAFKAADLPVDGTVPVEPTGFAPARPARRKNKT